MSAIEFHPADLEQNMATCIQFRRDAFLASFGSDRRWQQEAGINGERYAQALRRYAEVNPAGVVHVWLNGVIVGQLEFRWDKATPFQSYVNLFYLIPAARGTGIAEIMHRYVLEAFQSQSCKTVRLSVSQSNQRAIAFYRKHGWVYLNSRADDTTLHVYALELESVFQVQLDASYDVLF